MNFKEALKASLGLVAIIASLVPSQFVMAATNDSANLQAMQNYQAPTTSASQQPQVPASQAAIPGSNIDGFSTPALTPANYSPAPSISAAASPSPAMSDDPADALNPQNSPSPNNQALEDWIRQQRDVNGYDIYNCDPAFGDVCDDVDLGNGEICLADRQDGVCPQTGRVMSTFELNGAIYWAVLPPINASPSPAISDDPADALNPQNSPSPGYSGNPANAIYPENWESPNP